MKAQRERQPLFCGILLTLMIAVWAMFHVWTRTMAVEMGYALSEQRTLNEQLLTDNHALCLEISTLKSSKRLELIARNELGLVVPESKQVVYVWSDE